MTKAEYKKNWVIKNRERLSAKAKAMRATPEYKAARKAYCAAKKEEIRKAAIAWREKNKEKIIQRKKAHREANAEKIAEYARAYRKKNRAKLTADQLRRHKRLMQEDPSYRLMMAARSRINKVLRGAITFDKFGSTTQLLGCSPKELASHIQSLFLPGMHWNNRHLWHVDHIIPCSSFDMLNEDDQKKCFHYTNLRPLWAIDNLKKGKKIQ